MPSCNLMNTRSRLVLSQHSLCLLFLLALGGFAPGIGIAGQDADQPLEQAVETPKTSTETADDARKGKLRRHSLGDVFVMGRDAVVREDETARDVVVLGGTAIVDGTVTRDLVVVMGHAKLGSKENIRHH